ncbi:MAG: ATP-NAD kinase family protein, partial [Anaerolineae bacterium]
MATRVGLIVNPIAGMGGSVGLKGTDGEMVARARELGATPVTPDRTACFLSHVDHREEITWLAAPNEMGADYLTGAGVHHTIVGEATWDEKPTTADNTRRIAREMAAGADADLIVFVGGDGTARDIYDAVGTEIPVVGVPAGVKVYSAAFAYSPKAAAGMVDAFCEGADVTEAEVLDIDEAAFRDDRLDAKLYGYLLVPNAESLRQPGKEGTHTTPGTQENKKEIAAAIVEAMENETLYLLGPGTTVKAITDELGIEKTLLGIDAVIGGAIVGRDLNERGILTLLDQHDKCEIIVTPLGGNGFIFGRGNKPFTPKVIATVGCDGITVIATERKMRELGVLRVDTGDPKVDEMLSGYIEVIICYDVA